MDMESVENHGILKVIEFALENKRFSKRQACEYAGISDTQFDFIRNDVFILSGYQAEHVRNEVLTWELSPSAYFGYLQYLNFKYAVSSAERANRVAISAIVITAMLAIASIVISIILYL